LAENNDIQVCDWCLEETDVWCCPPKRVCTECLLQNHEALKAIRENLSQGSGLDASDLGPHEIMYVLSEAADATQYRHFISGMLDVDPHLVDLDLNTMPITDVEETERLIEEGNAHRTMALANCTIMARAAMTMVRHAIISDPERYNNTPFAKLALNETRTRALTKGLEVLRKAVPGAVEMMEAKILAREAEQNTL
jgi:hypothetical protein